MVMARPRNGSASGMTYRYLKGSRARMSRGGRVIVADCLTSSPVRSSDRGSSQRLALARHEAGQTTGNSGWSMSAPAGSSASRSSNGGEVRQARGACRAPADR
jgi:hypothetical protein